MVHTVVATNSFHVANSTDKVTGYRYPCFYGVKRLKLADSSGRGACVCAVPVPYQMGSRLAPTAGGSGCTFTRYQ